MKSVLLVSAGNVERGGVQMFLLNWIKHAPEGEYSFDWYFPGMIEDKELAEDFEREGVEMISAKIVLSKNTPVDKIIRFYKTCNVANEILKKRHYDIIHVNTGSVWVNAVMLSMAKRHGVIRRIAHSHNAVEKQAPKKKIQEAVFRNILHSATTHFAACSRKAAEFLFERDAKKARIIRNTIQTKDYSFSMEKRNSCRKELGFSDSFIVGHVGKFNQQKNHSFLIEVFREIVKQDSSARLLLVGTGELLEEIHQKVLAYKIEDKVCFTGATTEVSKYMCAMDVFVLPSLFEGLPIVGIEAQTSGLPCFFSDTITRETVLGGDCAFLSIDDSPQQWAEAILKAKLNVYNRKDAWKKTVEQGYDVSNMRQMIIELYNS